MFSCDVCGIIRGLILELEQAEERDQAHIEDMYGKAGHVQDGIPGW
jgi:hypothetical protein